jgi:hypothetical protein
LRMKENQAVTSDSSGKREGHDSSTQISRLGTSELSGS